MSESFAKYAKQLAASFRESGRMTADQAADFVEVGCEIFNKVDRFCTEKNLCGRQSGRIASFANESLTFDSLMAQAPIDSLRKLVADCGVAENMIKPCCEKVLNVLDRTVGKSSVEAWAEQNKSGAAVEGCQGLARQDLSVFHSASAISGMNEPVAGVEAFGATMDMVVPDMKVNIAIAIMSFHARILPRLLPQRPINEPLVQYKKETLEAYDLADPNGKRVRQIEMYSDPKFVSTNLQKIIARTANDPDAKFLAADGFVKFGVEANLLELAIDASKYGHDAINRTDIISDRVLLEALRISVVADGTTENFDVPVPMECRLSRQINAADSGDRAGDFKFRALLSKDSIPVGGSAASELLAGLSDKEEVILSFIVKPSCSIKTGKCNALGQVSLDVKSTDGSALSEAALALKAGTASLLAYSLDARYDEVNLRKSNIAIWSNTQPMAYDIPTGRNFVYDYALNQQNTEKVAANMMGVMGVAQDKDAMKQITDICNTVYDGIKAAEIILDENDINYIGKCFVAGDKVKPTIYMDTLDFSDINVIRDGDRSGDIKQKAITYLGAVSAKILNQSFFQQQLGGKSQVVFKCWCSIEVLTNIIGQVLYNPGIAEDTRGVLGDGVEYSLVLPNKVRLDFVTTTFADQQDKIVGIAVVESAESELNFGHNWDYGVLVSHYTVSGHLAHNRLFSNMRYLIVPTNPIAFVIDILGMDVVTGMALDMTLRPTFKISGEITNLNFNQGTGTEPANP